MKKVKIANGIRRIEDADAGTILFRLRDVLSEHRSVLVTRIISDLAAYIDYKFQTRPSSKELESIKETLYSLKNSAVELDRYRDIIEHFLENDMTYIRSEPFLKEIDDTIGWGLSQSQLKLV